jgi:hypothetical protein
MLVLASEQELGKSEFAKWLCSPLPGYFVESAVNPESVDHQRWATSHFIWEVGELGATTRRADVEALKSFLTRHEHTFRVPYARNEVHKPARVSWIGTVNPDNVGFLTDVTGNRRFLTVEVSAIDWRGYTAHADVHQVWAQACALYAQGPDAWQLSPEERETRNVINEDFSVEDPVRDAILAECVVTPGVAKGAGSFMSSLDLAALVEFHIQRESTMGLRMKIARALKGMGVTKGKSADEKIRGYWGVQVRINRHAAVGAIKNSYTPAR